MKTTFVKIAPVALFALLAATSCGTAKKAQSSPVSVTDKKEMAKQTGMAAEVEITLPCSGTDSDLEYIRVTGMGKSKDRMMAKDRAYQAALANLASKLSGVMAMDNMKVGVSTQADNSEDFHDKMVTVSKEVAQANVSGYRTGCEKYTVSPQDASYNCYVMIEFGNQKVVKEMYDKMSNDKMLKADYDFDRYMNDFNKDLKEYESKNK